MSESMAFIGGVAVAGLAALVLLKGTNTPLQSNFAIPQMPSPVMAPQVMQPMQYPPYGGQPAYPNPQPVAPNPNQSVETEKLNIQNERLKSENEQMKAQIQQQQNQLQYLTQAVWNNNNQQNNQQRIAPAALQPQNDNLWWRSPIVWAVGGATLTIGGGIVVAGVLALFSPRQRSSRTVQVIHPYHGPTPPLAPVRRAEFLPSRAEARRVETPEYDEIH
ncbi:hypothetical protein Cylst_2322 [Cylindrospermum stagnale PCC 7417]|uniref:Heterocyst differentiation related protein n=1 Tax=Cylindrospermum stagnale PCC 7417 TaxID=56107 RepID=K9WYG7_9NOST|nr:hypothetical protein [Cylindrospermum stagnale]AFZ24552.1 hypothetical protein Cylst_2322 [Cylindrospermum stagnale PCC 7417]